MSRMKTVPALLGLMVLAVSSADAGWSVGVSLHAPVYGRPCYPAPYCYRPYPYYVRPAPIFVQPVTVVEQVPVYAPAAVPVVARTPIATTTRTQEIDRYQQQLQSPEGKDRAEALVQLGRQRAPGSLASLTDALNNDRSPTVREAAARALGLFGTAEALEPLQKAALGDEDREVRRSAAFAADVIRSNLPRK